MSSYVTGFLCDYSLDRFLLIDKGFVKALHEAVLKWQGPGGRIENRIPGYDIEYAQPVLETPHACMEREFLEETGYLVKQSRWHCFHIKQYTTAKLYFFVSLASPDELTKVVRSTERAGNPEGRAQVHSYVDVLFSQEQYTFDVPYLINMIIRESRNGFLMKLDPEGVNSAQKNSS